MDDKDVPAWRWRSWCLVDGSYDDGDLLVIMVVPYHVICYSRCSTTTCDAYGRSRTIDPSQISSYHALPTKIGGGTMELGCHQFSLARQVHIGYLHT